MAATAVRAKVVLSGCGCLLFLLLVFLEDGSTGAGHGLGAFELQAPPHIFLVIIYTNIENHIILFPIIPPVPHSPPPSSISLPKNSSFDIF